MKKLISFIVTLIIILTSVSYSQWIPVGVNSSLGGDIAALLEYNGVLYAGGTAYLFRSTDEINWTGYLGPLAYAWSLTQSNGKIFCGLSYSSQPGVYVSTNNGLNWIITSLSNTIVDDMVSSGSQVYASSIAQGKIFSTTDNGQTWTTISTGTTGYLSVSGNRLYCALSGLKVSTNNGLNWILLHNEPGKAVVADDSLVIFGTQNGNIYRSTNYGQTWTKTYEITNAYVYSLYKYGNNIFAGLDTNFVVSTNLGLSFFNRKQNLGATRVTAIMVYNNYVYVGNGDYGAVPVSLWKRPLADVIGIKPLGNEVPESYRLYQNFPNPFNQTTVIRFDIARAGKVKLNVFDITGREVTVLIDESLQPNKYQVVFDAENLSSGIYFYTLRSGEFIQTYKMLLLK
jgi:hypothetical protein